MRNMADAPEYSAKISQFCQQLFQTCRTKKRSRFFVLAVRTCTPLNPDLTELSSPLPFLIFFCYSIQTSNRQDKRNDMYQEFMATGYTSRKSDCSGHRVGCFTTWRLAWNSRMMLYDES
uniref:Uncharacterized protein n=1 Tax=Guillardia theta TaxID=55529 RepID=A0A7S4K3R3_GUITH|mmetsp:Transcript_20813/g.69471  ORF Transcript_20813/g.69471 Transcript_20813/m.69471 type:complete len:119 (+) Transcript_20813:474-830(+)